MLFLCVSPINVESSLAPPWPSTQQNCASLAPSSRPLDTGARTDGGGRYGIYPHRRFRRTAPLPPQHHHLITCSAAYGKRPQVRETQDADTDAAALTLPLPCYYTPCSQTLTYLCLYCLKLERMNKNDTEVEIPTSPNAISLDLTLCFPNVSTLLRCIIALTKEQYYKFGAHQTMGNNIFGVNTDLLNSEKSTEVRGGINEP